MTYDPQQQRPEEQIQNANRESLNIRQPGEDGRKEYWNNINWGKHAAKKTESPGITGNIADMGRAVWSGVDNAALNVMEAVSKVPLIGDPIVSGIHAIDKHVFGIENTEEFLKQDQQQTIANMTPQMQEALNKDWWDSDKGKLGSAWSDWRSYAGGAVQSLPEMALTMAPAVRLAKMSYASKIAGGADAVDAGLAAARTASITGKITEGILAGGASSRETRDTIMSLPDNVLLQSEAAQNLIHSGMNIEDARKTLAEDGSTKAFLMSGVVTGVFGGQGDKIIAKILTGQLNKSILPRFIKGAVAEGVMEELPQSMGSRLAENYAIQNADPTHKLSDDVLNQGLGGTASGAVLGGTIAGASRPGKWDVNRPATDQQPANPENQPATPEYTPDGQQPITPQESNVQQQEAAPQPAPGQFATEEVVGAAPTRTDEFRDTPAYLRQDPRIQGFAEDNEVQRALAEQQPSPTADELIRQQIDGGDQGFTPEELAAQERADKVREALMPRLPPPGKTSVIAMPGEIATHADEVQAGSGPQFRGGEQVRGQQFIPREAQPNSDVERVSQTYDSEPVHPAGLPDNRHRVAGVPVDSQAEAFAGQPATPAPEQRSVNPINDFGEEIQGAAKHKWGKFSEAMEQQTTDEQYRTEPLSKLFPQPDYSRMSTDGVSHDKLALLAILRAQIPASKPKRFLQRWVDSAHAMKTLSAQVLDGQVSVEDLRQRMTSNGSLAGMKDTHDLIASLPPEQMASASKYRVSHSSYSVYDGKRYPNGHAVYELETAKGASVRGVADTDKAAFMEKARAYIDQESGRAPAPKQTDLGIYANRQTRDVFIGYKGASGVTSVKGGFKDPRDARDYLKENRAELEAQIAKQREQARTEQRRADNAPRKGVPRRSGDVTPEQFDKDFGFRGVQFGNYVESGRRQAELNDAYDSLNDMADIIGVPPKAISLNGELGLAFGARGRGGSNAAKAHYEPGEVVINLTKAKGAGSLAHEWFHALDNYFGQADVGGGRGSTFATNRQRQSVQVKNGKIVPAEHPVRSEVWEAFQGVKKAINDSGMVERAQKLDELRSKPYWATEVEMAARAYERYILDRAEAKGISNDYLVNLKKSNEHANPETYAYPTEAELNSGVRDAFDTLFKTLKTKPTDKGIALYSREGADIGDGNIISEGNFDAAGGKPEKGMTKVYAQRVADYWVRNLNGAAKIKVEVVQTQAEAADMMPNGIPKEFGTVHAIYQPELSRVIVVADNIADGAHLRAKLRHEILVHHGLASVIGDVEYDRIIRVLHQTRDSKNAEIQDVWRQVKKSYGNESAEVQANEFLAHMAERSELTGLGAAWDRFVSVITNALRKIGFFNPGDITPAEIRNILRTIAGRFKRTAMYDGEQPGTREFDNTFSRTDALYSTSKNKDPFKPDHYDAKEFAAEVEDIAGMDNAPRHMVRMGDTPAVYRALGARNLEMAMPASVVHKATDPMVRAHQVRLEDMQRLPELLADPVAVMRSSTESGALVSLVEAKDAHGDPVIAAIHMNSKGAGFAEINKIASVYGKDNKASLQRQLNENLLYLNNEKATKWLHAVGLQLPEANTLSGSSKNILSPADIRKNTALYSRAAAPTMDEITNRKMGFNVEKGKIAKAKDFYNSVRSKDKAELKSWIHEIGRKLNTKTFDGLAPLKYAEDAAGKSDARSSAYIGARMAAGAGSVTSAALEHGLPKYNKAEGIVERQAGTGKEDALMGILDALGNHRENFLKWIAGHRSERLMAEGKENNFTAEEIAYMKGLNQGNEALFNAQKKKYDAFIKSILDLQQDMGLIDPESRANWESAWYLPYYREAENGEVRGPWSTRGIANQSSTVRKLKGSELTIKDPIENLFNYVAKSVDASMKNEAMRRAVANLADTGVLEVIESPNKMDFERIGKDVVKVFTDGKEQLVQVNDPELYRAFTMIDLERSNSVFMKAARQAKKVLTLGTTSMPDFIIRNFIRDSLHSWSINSDGFKAVTDSFRGFSKALKTDDSLIDMMFAGASFGGGYSNVYDPASTAKSIRSVLRRKGYTDSQVNEFESSIVRNSKEAMDKVGIALHKYRHVSEAAENANRVATYDAAIKAGKSKAQAAFESRDLMDFSMMGASKIMINLSDMLPFFNARMQGLSKLGRAIKDDPQGVMMRGGMITAASLGLLALNWGDKRYEELPDWDKDTYWHFFLGDLHVRMPKPFEIGLMYGTLPERFVRALGGQDTPGKFGKLVAHNFMETVAFNPIPQVALPIAEAYVNYDFFKGGPIENMADSNLIAGARYNDQTSLLMRQVGQATGISPKMLDHIIQGYTGSLGAYVMGATNIMMRGVQDNGETPAMRLDEMPVIKSLIRGYGDDPAKSTQFAEDFYRKMQEVNEINSTINAYRKQGRKEDAAQLLEENREKLAQRKKMTATQREIRQLNNQIELVRIDRILTAEQKRERIDRFMARRNILVQQAVERVNPYFNK